MALISKYQQFGQQFPNISFCCTSIPDELDSVKPYTILCFDENTYYWLRCLVDL